MAENREYWLRGPVNGIPSLIQPVAHALLQARDEINNSLIGFPDHLLWVKPVEIASVGFHLQHLRGVLDRLFTYAMENQLTETQMEELRLEGKPYSKNYTTRELLDSFNTQVERAIEQLRNIDPAQLTDRREVGRAKIPSTLIGLLFHAAEHTMRHTGQLLVTAKFVVDDSNVKH